MKRIKSLSVLLLITALLFSLCACSSGTQGAAVDGTSTAVTVVGDYIYYINGIGSTPAEDYQYQVQMGALCRMQKDGTQREIVLPMCIATYQIADNTIFAVMLDANDQYIIIRSDMDGNDCRKIATMVSGTFQYLQGWLYFQSEEGLVRTDPDGNGKLLIDSRTPTSTSVWGNYLYCTFADEQSGIASLEKIPLDASSAPEVIKNTECYMMGSGKDGVYYLSREDSILYQLRGSDNKSIKMVFTLYAEYAIDDKNSIAYGCLENGGLYMHNMLTGEKKKLNSFACDDIIITDKYLYFSNASDNGFLYRTSLETYESQIVTATVPLSGRTYVIDGYIYYTSPNERSRIYRINEETLERVSIHYGY